MFCLYVLSGYYNQCSEILLTFTCQHCAYLDHCWSIVNVFRVRMCSQYSHWGVYQEILSLGQYFPIHSQGSRECIG